MYYVPPEVPFIPIAHRFLFGGCRDRFDPEPLNPPSVGDDQTTWRSRYIPPNFWLKVGEHFCGSVRQWQEGSVASDPPLEWTEFGYSTCCEGVVQMGTANRISKFGVDGITVIDSTGFDDGGGAVEWDALLRMVLGMEARETVGGTVLGGLVWNAPVGAVEATITSTFDVDAGMFGYLALQAASDRVRLHLTSDGYGGWPQIVLQGVGTIDSTDLGFDIRSGLVFAVPSAGDLATALGFGSAAYLDSSDVLLVANDLADLTDPATARTNLELGTAAVEDEGHFLVAANNLSDVPDPATARTNLGITGGGGQPLSVFAYKSGTMTLTGSSHNTVVFNTEDVDLNGEYDTTTGEFTPDVDGYYEVGVNVQLDGGFRYIALVVRTTGPTDVAVLSFDDTAAAGRTRIIHLTGGEPYWISAYNAGANIDTFGGADSTWLTWRLIQADP